MKTLNQDLAESLVHAQFLCDSLRAAHTKLCVNEPELEEKLAERYVLDLLNQAVAIKHAMGGLAK